MPETECRVCINWDEPCKSCATEIHQSWHALGWWWIRSEMCDPTCVKHKDTIARLLKVVIVTPRDRARDKQLRARGER